MKINKNIVAAALVAAASFSAFEAEACTNFIVGKKASADGSVMCTYNADDYGIFNSCSFRRISIIQLENFSLVLTKIFTQKAVSLRIDCFFRT